MKISVITINYNNASGLKSTIESVVNQTYKDYEYIIIDGGSTDGSVEIIKQYADKITYWVSEKDRGIYHAMNKGIAIAKGDYCNFMNSGDYYYDNDVITKFKEKCNGSDICIGDACCIKTLDNKIYIWHSPFAIKFSDIYLASPNHQAAFIQTLIMKKYLYNESLKIVADWNFFIQTLILENCSYQKLNFIIVNYILGGFSTRDPNLYNKERIQVIKELRLPERIIIDYEKYSNPRLLEKIIRRIPKQTWTERILIYIVYIFYRISKLFR